MPFIRYVFLALALACATDTVAQPLREPEPANVVKIQSPDVDRELFIAEFYAPAIARTTKYMVLLPKSYDDPGRRFPVLYLLHGFSQNYTVWPMLGVPKYTAELDLIVVMPDAGNSWYIDWAESENGEKNDWETFIIRDLIESVDTTFRTVPFPQGRAINGMSMGGYGALTLGLRHPELFCSVGTHSGTLSYARNARMRIEAGEKLEKRKAPQGVNSEKDANVPDVIAIQGFTRQSERYPEGVPFLTVEDCDKYDPFKLVLERPPAELPHIYIDCGLNDSLLQDSQEFMAVLLANQIPFVYSQGSGGHSPNYWLREVRQSIVVQYAEMLERLEQ